MSQQLTTKYLFNCPEWLAISVICVTGIIAIPGESADAAVSPDFDPSGRELQITEQLPVQQIDIVTKIKQHRLQAEAISQRLQANTNSHPNHDLQDLSEVQAPKLTTELEKPDLTELTKSRTTALIAKLKRVSIPEMDAINEGENPSPVTTDDVITKLKTFRQQNQTIAQSDSSGVVGDTFGEINKLRQQLLIDPIDPVIVRGKPPVASPSSSAGTPTAYGVGSRQAYIGGGVSFPLDSKRDRTDGSLSFGFGEGDPVNSLGIEFNFNITSIGDANDFDFGDSGTIGFKLHRFIGRGTAVAFGWSNPIRWGDTDRTRPTLYGVVTTSIPLQPNNPNHQLPLTVSVGVGSGVFRSKGAFADGQDTPNVFGSVGLQVIPQASLVSSWTGNRLNLGVSVVPIKNVPLVINAIYTDVTDNLNFGSGLSIIAGSGFRF